MILRLAAALAALAAPVRAQETPYRPFVRLPSVEVFSTREAEALSGPEQPLTDKEKDLARTIFQDSVDLDVVRIVRAKTGSDEAVTLGNVIRAPGASKLRGGSLLHELVHVWQYQTGGTGYISDSLTHQAFAYASTRDRNRAYRYVLSPGKSFFAYTAEQQAQIIEDYANGDHPERKAAYERLAAELRTRKAGVQLAASPALSFEESLPSLSWRVPLPAGQTPSFFVSGVPQIEFDFGK